jgi:hypothetical protein
MFGFFHVVLDSTMFYSGTFNSVSETPGHPGPWHFATTAMLLLRHCSSSKIRKRLFGEYSKTEPGSRQQVEKNFCLLDDDDDDKDVA